MAVQNTVPLRGELLFNEPLAGYTSWRIGGPAKQLYRPVDKDDLVAFLQTLPANESLLWLGLGSNLLVRDGGFAGTVINLRGCLNAIKPLGSVGLSVEAGASCAKVARTAAKAGLCGVEFLAGIPGTLGGALAMNAGAFGGEMWEHVSKVATVDRQGQVFERMPNEFEIAYRSVKGVPGEWFIAAELQLNKGDVVAGQERIKRLLEKRAASQPIGLPSCGSVFRNPVNDHAARLIEAAGLKGRKEGDAQVSERHANFIINTGNATASEVEQLIKTIQQKVERHSGQSLETEVHIVGVPGDGK